MSLGRREVLDRRSSCQSTGCDCGGFVASNGLPVSHIDLIH
jgi:hypothetical protein